MNKIKEYNNNCISDTSSLMDALSRLEQVDVKILFVVSGEGILKASLTDGDVRRAILRGDSLNTDVMQFARLDPAAVHEDDDEEAMRIFNERKLSAIPVIDKDGRVTGILSNWKKSRDNREKLDIPVVIMAGGKGTRLYPYTRVLPKPLIPVENVPISERIIKSFHDRGCKDIHMVVNYRKNMIKAYYNELDVDYNIRFHDEDTPLGTGGGLKLLESDIDGTFILTNCDILILEDIADIIKHHKDNDNKVTMVCSLKNYEIPYGVVHFTEGGDIDSFEEKPKMSFFTNTGYYVLERDVFDHIGDGENIGMPDIVERMKKAGLKVGVYPIGERSWLDMGQFDSMSSMEAFLRDGRIDAQ